MAEDEPEKQLRMVIGSSTQRKPLSNLTNLIPQPHPHQSKKTTSSAASAISDSGTGFTQNRNRVKHQIIVLRDQHSLPTPRTPTSDDWIGDGNHIANSRRPTMLKTKNKIKAAAVTVQPTHLEKTKNNIEDLQIPLSEFKDNGKAVIVNSSLVDPSKKPEEINHVILEKKDKGGSCHPLLRIRSNRNEVDGAEDALKSKSPTDPIPNNKKRRYTSKRSPKEFVLPQDFIDQQRAYFKEVDEYELEVEEVSV